MADTLRKHWMVILTLLTFSVMAIAPLVTFARDWGTLTQQVEQQSHDIRVIKTRDWGTLTQRVEQQSHDIRVIKTRDWGTLTQQVEQLGNDVGEIKTRLDKLGGKP